MIYQVKIKRSAQRELADLPRTVQGRVRKRVRVLANNPRPPGCKKLAGTEDLWRIRVGDYRVIYMVRDDVLLVLVIRITHRAEAYR